jgi:hypothetical protein
MRLNLPIAIVPLSRTDYWILDFQPPATYLGDEQMLCILGRGRSVPTVTKLIFVRAQCLTILLLKHFALCGTITGSSYCSACFNSKMVNHYSLSSHTRIVTSKQHSKTYVDVSHCTVNTFIHKHPIFTLSSLLHGPEILLEAPLSREFSREQYLGSIKIFMILKRTLKQN